jgi:hypothetical protein
MKLFTATKMISALTVSLLIANSAYAAPAKKENPWYIQGNIGVVFETNSSEQSSQDLTALGHEVTFTEVITPHNSIQLELGYQLTENIALTAGYIDFGDVDYNVSVNSKYTDELIKDIAKTGPKYGNGNTFGVVYSYELLPSLVASVDAGVLFLESEYDVTLHLGSVDKPIYYTQTTSDSSTEKYGGLGLSYFFNKFEVGGYYRYYDIDGVASQWAGIRLGYHF